MRISSTARSAKQTIKLFWCLPLAAILSVGFLSGADQINSSTNVDNATPITNDSDVNALLPNFSKTESFFDWLLRLGADSNQVYQLRLDKQMRLLADQFADQSPEKDKVYHLVNQKNLSPFYTWTEKDGVFCDPDGVFSITNGMLRISGKQRGYVATRGIYADYRLVAEYRWGSETWGARKLKTRNSGLCIHGTGLDKVWMKSVEVQIAEGQTGDVVVLDGARLTSNGITKMRAYDTFKRPGTSAVDDRLGFRAPDDLEKPHGEWNVIEILCQGSLIKVTINGKPAFEGIGSTPNSGRILIQSNGAEIFFRKLDLYPLR